MRTLMEFLKPYFGTLLIICGVGLVICGIIYALFYKKINKLIAKYKEIVLYFIFGVLTTLVNFAVYTAMAWVLNDNKLILISNFVAWVVAVIFAFVVNKWFVFESKTTEKKAVMKELAGFLSARLLSLGAESLILGIFVSVMGLNELVFKLITQIIVLVMNYIFSKLIIFKNKK